MRNQLLLILSVLWLASCGPEPVYSEELGFSGVATMPGDHEGTFALKAVSASQIIVTKLGKWGSGGVNYRLVTRTYDADNDKYLQTSKICGGYNFEVQGVVTGAPESSYRKVPRSMEEWVKINHDTGEYNAYDHVQLWGIDLPDPLKTAFPKDREEAGANPHLERIYDMDEDLFPGVTLVVSGILTGDVYAAQRKRVELEGLVLGPDEVWGYTRTKYDTVRIGASKPELLTEGKSIEHPDIRERWFQEVRISEGSDCDDVMKLEGKGTLSKTRPYK